MRRLMTLARPLVLALALVLPVSFSFSTGLAASDSPSGHKPVTPKPIARSTAQSYIWGEINSGWHLVKADAMSVIEEEMSPGGREAPHYHRTSRQFFYVLSGELSMVMDDTQVVVRAGSGLEIAPGMVHQAINMSDTTISFLVISVPPSHGDRVLVEKGGDQ